MTILFLRFITINIGNYYTELFSIIYFLQLFHNLQLVFMITLIQHLEIEKEKLIFQLGS